MNDIVPPPSFTARMVRELKGAPLSCFVLLSLSTTPVSNEWLCIMSGYTDKPIAQALKLLSSPEYQIARRCRGGWMMAKSFQLIMSNDESRKISVPTTTTYILTESTKEEVVAVSRKNSDSDEDANYLVNFEACRQYGIFEPSASQISNLPHVNPELIERHVKALKPGETIGLAIVRIKNNETILANPKAEKKSAVQNKIDLLRKRASVEA